MSIKTVNVASEFYPWLRNRNKHQGDGKFTAVEFRDKFLSELYDEEKWKTDDLHITLDFKDVKKIGPSFANEAFAYFCRFKDASPDRILAKIKMTNLSEVKFLIIEMELKEAYKKNFD